MDILSRLRAILSSESLLTEDEAMRPFECDGLSAYRRLPFAVVLPETLAQVQAVLQACHEAQVPVVVRGAGTGLSGGALPHAEGILLCLSKFNRVLDIDLENRSATVEPGVTNLAISKAVDSYGLYYAPDPSSQVACTIGGNVAENSGGVHCLKYGLTVHNVLQLKVLTMTGELVVVGAESLDVPGYDLLAVMIGSEGLLGVVMEVTVKLLPKPESVEVILVSFDDIARAGAAVAGVIAAGIIPAGLELMDALAIQASEDYAQAGYPRDAAAILLCEIDGNADDVVAQREQIIQVMRANQATDVRVASDPVERQRFWAGRKGAFPAMGRLAPDYYCMDGTIPRARLEEVLSAIGEMSERYQLPIANVFHAGDGNLHPLILYDANLPEQLHKAEQLGGEILRLCIDVGGTITGEHGVGVEKIDQMCDQFAAPELAQFHAIKDAFDPSGLLNPGKAVPILKRCSELGGMHVHNGELPFPDLERY